MYLFIYLCMYVYTKYVCMDGWMDGWMDMYVCMYVCIFIKLQPVEHLVTF